MGESGSNPNPAADLPSASPCPSKEKSSPAPQLLIVDDNPADVFLIRAAIKEAGIDADIIVARDGEQAVRIFDQADQDDRLPCPAIVILDINLPKRLGSEVLLYMRASRRCANARVVVVSTSSSPQDYQKMMNLGASSYFRKPSDYLGFMKLGDMIKGLL